MFKITLLAASAALTLSACSQNDIDPSTAIVRTGPQIQSPTADSPNGNLPTDGTSVVTPVIIDDSATDG